MFSDAQEHILLVSLHSQTLTAHSNMCIHDHTDTHTHFVTFIHTRVISKMANIIL